MGATTGIGWTDATVNFAIGCQHAGPGCDGCYAEVFAERKFGIKFGPGEPRRPTKVGFTDPPKWQRAIDAGRMTMRHQGKDIPIPFWVFACSLSDFFDRAWPKELRPRAWEVIKATPDLHWQLVTKRVGNVQYMLPDDWNGGKGYEHVGIIATMVNQQEINRDMPKLANLRDTRGVRWVGLSIEPQLEMIRLGPWRNHLDWVITGGESKQGAHAARPYDIGWARSLILECHAARVQIFVKQMGDNPIDDGKFIKSLKGSDNPAAWPIELRWQQMPDIYPERKPKAQPAPVPAQKELL